MTRKLAALSFTAFALLSLGAQAGPGVPAKITVDGQELVLNGTGMRQATVFKVDVYKAALYLPAKEKDPKKILATDQAWQLDLFLVRDLEKKQLTEAFEEGFKKNAKNAAAVQGGLAKINGYMSDVKTGDTLRFRYVPGKGTTVSVQGKVKGTIAGADFGAALLSVWLGASPPNEGLKTGLLGG